MTLFAQIIRYKTKNKENIFNLTVLDLGRYSNRAQQLALRGGHRVNRREEFLMEAGAEVGDGSRRVVSNKTEGKLQFRSQLTLMAQALVPCQIQFHLSS